MDLAAAAPSLAQLQAELAELRQLNRVLQDSHDTFAIEMDTVWVLLTAVLVFFMQVGFAMLEVGSVSPKNTKSILIKNCCDTAVCTICWWLVGYGFAFGESAGGFIGTSEFALAGPTFNSPDGAIPTPQIGYNIAFWFFGWTFAATSTTIVSGAIAERVKVTAYIIFCVFVSSLIYPVVVHWIWSDNGWASATNFSNLLMGCGAVDFAGSGGVHMVGGTCSLVAAVVAQPRARRFNEDGSVNKMQQQSPALQTLGALILWAGWYGFNGGSTLTVTEGRSAVAAVTMVNTAIAPSAGAITVVILHKLLENRFDSSIVNNGILVALVGITAGCSVVSASGAFVIGVVSGLVYMGARRLMLWLRIDDVAEAAPVHLFGGLFGVTAVGFFATPTNYAAAYPDPFEDRASKCHGVLYGGSGHLLAAQICYTLALLLWVGTIALLLFLAIKHTIGLRVSLHEEEIGMDNSRRQRSTSKSLLKALSAAGIDASAATAPNGSRGLGTSAGRREQGLDRSRRGPGDIG